MFEHIVDVDSAITEVGRVLGPGGRFLFFLNHPLLQTPGSGWIDIRRTRALWGDFEGPLAIVKRNDWIDRPSVSIAFSYLVAGSELASLLSERQDVSAADSVMATLRRVARAVRVDHLMTDANPPPVPRGDTSR